MRVYVAAKSGSVVERVARRALEARRHEALLAPPAPPGIGVSRVAFEMDFGRLSSADLLLADAGEDALDVGWKLGWFASTGRLLVVCAPAARAGALPPVVGGNPSPWQRLVTYADEADLEEQLASLLA